MLTDAAPGLRVGYDPCHDDAIDAACMRDRDFAGFVADALAAAPEADMIYLD